MKIPKYPPSVELQKLLEETEPEEADCAWCLQEQGLPMGEGSHGICKDHAEEQYQRCREVRKAA